jgi:hypothetical protein
MDNSEEQAEDIYRTRVMFGSPLNLACSDDTDVSSYAALAPFSALSTPSWNNTYYLDVLPKLIEMGTNLPVGVHC